MTKRRWIIAGGLFAVLVIVLLVATARSPANPTHKGRKLSAWIEGLAPIPFRANTPADALYISWKVNEGLRRHSSVSPDENPVIAIREIGTNAIPYLLDLVYESDSVFTSKLIAWSRKQKLLNLRLKTADEKRGHALGALAVLGPSAVSAWIDTLTNSSSTRTIRGFALLQLSFLGRKGAPACPAALYLYDDSDRSTRQAIRQMIWACDADGCFKGWLDLQEGRDIMTTSRGAQMVGSLTNHPELALPALSAALSNESHWVRHSAVEALGKFGTNAFSSVRGIRLLLYDPELRVREAATNALERINPQ